MIAVFGATGNVGGKVAAMLLERGIPVRVLVRSADKAIPLKNDGAEIVEGDLFNIRDIEKTFDRCDGAFLMTPVNPASDHPAEDEITVGRNYAEALRDSTIGHIVYLSVLTAGTETGVPNFDSKTVVESLLSASDVEPTFLRAAFFMENIYSQARNIREHGVISLPLPPETVMPMVSTEDVAYVAAESLARGGRGCANYDLLGPENYTLQQVTQIASKVLGKELRYQELPQEQSKEMLMQMGYTPGAVESMLAMLRYFRTAWADWSEDDEFARQRVYNEFNFEPTTLETILSTTARVLTA